MSCHRTAILRALTGTVLGMALIGSAGPANADDQLTFTPDPSTAQFAAVATSGDRIIVVYVDKVGSVPRCFYLLTNLAGDALSAPQAIPLLPTYFAQNRPAATVEADGSFLITCENSRLNAQATAKSRVRPGQTQADPPEEVFATDTNPATPNAGSFNHVHPAADTSMSSPHVGNLYLNRKITGAMVGAHPFGGFNLSGTDSKTGGKDYLLLFLQAKSIAEKV